MPLFRDMWINNEMAAGKFNESKFSRLKRALLRIESFITQLTITEHQIFRQNVFSIVISKISGERVENGVFE